MAADFWTVVLAAGAGRRLSSVTGGMPKQFWRGAQGKSLLEETADRFSPLSPPSRTVIVVDRSHRDYLSVDEHARRLGTLMLQPQDRGTAAGVLLGLMPVLESGDDAIVALTPADHGVVDDVEFRRGVRQAARYAGSTGEIVLFGVEPAVAHDDYGWITPGPVRSPGSMRPVTSFVEKPSRERASELLAAGAVWNTMVLVGPARALRDLSVALVPGLAQAFAIALQLPLVARDAFLASAYSSLPTLDFSRDVIAPARNLATYIWPASIGWSDLGTPERLFAWQARESTQHASVGAITAA